MNTLGDIRPDLCSTIRHMLSLMQRATMQDGPSNATVGLTSNTGAYLVRVVVAIHRNLLWSGLCRTIDLTWNRRVTFE